MENSSTNIGYDNRDTRKVIDGDSMKQIGTFVAPNTEKEIEYYKSLGKWADVSVDSDGDIILYEEETD